MLGEKVYLIISRRKQKPPTRHCISHVDFSSWDTVLIYQCEEIVFALRQTVMSEDSDQKKGFMCLKVINHVFILNVIAAHRAPYKLQML